MRRAYSRYANTNEQTINSATIRLKVIKEFGGATIAQDPETATFKSMPQNAIDADAADYILAPLGIGVFLASKDKKLRNAADTLHFFGAQVVALLVRAKAA